MLKKYSKNIPLMTTLKNSFCIYKSGVFKDQKWLNTSIFDISASLKLNSNYSNALFTLFTSEEGVAHLVERRNPLSHGISQEMIKKFIDQQQQILLDKKSNSFEQFMHVIDYLLGDFGRETISFNRIQSRFGSTPFKFFPNHAILNKFYTAYSENVRKAHYFSGPQNIGKSFNLALFRFLLLSDTQKNRVIYINNLDAWIQDLTPIKAILNDLQFTFADHLQEGDLKQFEICYALEGKFDASFDERLAALRRLLEHHMLRGQPAEKRVLIIDQWNVMARMRDLASSITQKSLVEALYQIDKIIRALSDVSNKRMMIASLNDEGFEKQNQEVETHILYDCLSKPVCREFIISTFNKTNPIITEEEYSLIEQTSGKIPGEVAKISRMSGETIEDKVTDYRTTRQQEIEDHLAVFYQKRSTSLKDPQMDELLAQRSKIAAVIDMNISVPGKSVQRIFFDQRYIYRTRKDNLIKSIFPVVTQAFRSLYYETSVFMDMLALSYKTGNFGVFGKMLEIVILEELTRVKTNCSIKSLDGSSIISFNLEIPSKTTFKDLASFNIPSSENSDMVLLTPENPYFHGLDFILIIPRKKLVLAVQLKYTSRLYFRWKGFMNPLGETTTTSTATDSKKTKEAFKSHCKNNKYDAAFVLMYLFEEKNEKLHYDKVKKELGGENIYLWEAEQLGIFNRLLEVINK